MRINAATGALSSAGALIPLQPAPYAISVDPAGMVLEESSVGGDLLRAFSIDQSNVVLTALPLGKVRAGSEPVFNVAYASAEGAAAVFRPRFAYVPNADDDTISAYTVDAATGNSPGQVSLFGEVD